VVLHWIHAHVFGSHLLKFRVLFLFLFFLLWMHGKLIPDENVDIPRECFTDQLKGELYELQGKT